MKTPELPPALPAHVGQALQAIADMQTAHHEEASRLAHMVDRITATVARPGFLIYVGAAMILWIGANLLLGRAGLAMPDAPPYPLLALAVSCVALFIAVLILASQTRADRLANLRQQMTLEVALLTTQKASKLVELMEEFRRDSPNVKDRVDLQAREMADAPDHGTVLQAIQEITNNPPGTGG
ncbi:MAG TPA: DUF1003 domain-containing protein [Rhizomicrobium sp.]|nr:DUF1003 domain-containing protein [Rhizomicrobium sp.]